MFKSFLSITAVLFALNAHASTPNLGQKLVETWSTQIQFAGLFNLGWKVGDTADYNVDMGFIKGTMHTFVREEVERGYWLQQDMKLGAMGDQKIEILIDKNTGQTLEVIVNGERQEPQKNDMEIIETREEKVTVPAGTFDTLYVQLKNKSDGKITEAWVNPQEIPMSGMLKTIAPGPFGKVTVELTSFLKK